MNLLIWVIAANTASFVLGFFEGILAVHSRNKELHDFIMTHEAYIEEVGEISKEYISTAYEDDGKTTTVKLSLIPEWTWNGSFLQKTTLLQVAYYQDDYTPITLVFREEKGKPKLIREEFPEGWSITKK